MIGSRGHEFDSFWASQIQQERPEWVIPLRVILRVISTGSPQFSGFSTMSTAQHKHLSFSATREDAQMVILMQEGALLCEDHELKLSLDCLRWTYSGHQGRAKHQGAAHSCSCGAFCGKRATLGGNSICWGILQGAGICNVLQTTLRIDNHQCLT